MTRTSEYRCFVATWQCSAPYCQFNCCNNLRSVLRVSSISAVLARPHPQWLSCLWTTQRGDGRQVFQVRRMQAVHEWLHCQPKDFFSRGIHVFPKRSNTCMGRNGDYVEKWSHCVPFVFNKLRDKKYLRFSFDSPTYIMHTGYPNERMDSDFCQKYIIWNCLNYICISDSLLMYLTRFSI
jgi:hypothetical protein